ncbi:MAG: YHS domain-containing (seleno)protein [Erythrobacter sp.]|uniref:YHS domain-containing (seleno)protein n=1 Tax=Erythrobacter sp. Alg231-14 TaxID=1922225 RepID=UPI000D54B19E
MKLKFLMLAAAAFGATVAGPIALTTPAHADGGVFVGVEGSTVALSGYDSVSYFQGNGTPVLGNARFMVEHDGAQFHFSSQANADLFEENPDRYAPQYGGHCAWAMSRGSLAPGDPTLYKIHGGKLYLNFNRNVQETWLGDVDGFIAKSDPAWANVPDGKRFGD